MARRYDRAELLTATKTPEGYLLVEGFAARPGILRYRDAKRASGWRRELVRADALHAPDSLASLARKPVTLAHPPEFVGPDNVDAYGVGDVDGEITIADNGFVRVRAAIRRRDAIEAAAAGSVQLSCGYEVDVVEESGTDAVFGEYDAVQSNRRYNHLAIVDVARGGDALRIRLDAGDAFDEDPPTPEVPVKLHPAVVALIAAGSLTRSDGAAADADAPADLTLAVKPVAPAAVVAEPKVDAAEPDGARFDGAAAAAAAGAKRAAPRVPVGHAAYRTAFEATLPR